MQFPRGSLEPLQRVMINVADDPSRGEIDHLVAAQAKHEQVEPVKILKALGPVA